MQSYNLSVSPTGGAQSINVTARRFVYESGKTAPEGGDTRIIVKPDNGNEIVLRPGQSFGLEAGALASVWYVRAFDPAQTVAGSVIIGSGEFEDNSLKVDANSGSISVHTDGPVDLSEATKKSLTEDSIMAYTHHKRVDIPIGNAATLVLSAAENVAGVIIERVQVFGDMVCYMQAKETLPTSRLDGDILSVDLKQTWHTPDHKRMKIAPGKALYLWNTNAPSSGGNVFVFLTIL